VFPLQIPALKDTTGDAQGVEQLEGELICKDVEQSPSIAVNVTTTPIGILITVFPEIVPALEVIVALSETLNAKLNVPIPEQTPCPALSVGVTHPLGVIQLAGLVTVIFVEAHPFNDVAVNTTLVPTAIPVIMLPLIVPVEAEMVPLVLKLTLYVVPLQIALLTVIKGATKDGC
jgi:hypothetical protein